MLAIDATYLGRHYMRRNGPGDRERTRQLLLSVQESADEMRLPVAATIARMLTELVPK